MLESDHKNLNQIGGAWNGQAERATLTLSTHRIPDLGNASGGIPIKKYTISWPPHRGWFFFAFSLGLRFEWKKY